VSNRYALDTATEKYVCNKDTWKTLAPQHGDSLADYPNMRAKSVNVSLGEAYANITVQYEGFFSLEDKLPTGGGSLASGQFPIQTHPNYSGEHPNQWGVVFGTGGSPNEFGRYLKDDGFSHFGKLPNGDGKHQRPNASSEKGASQLEGVTSFLDPSNGQYRYSKITPEKFAKWGDLGKIVKPSSTHIPVPDLPDDRDWLLVSINEQPIALGDGFRAYNTTVEFLGSGPGGANPLIYQKGGTWRLDS